MMFRRLLCAGFAMFLFATAKSAAWDQPITEHFRLDDLLTYSFGGPNRFFGASVAIDGNVAVVASPGTSSNLKRVFVFERIAGRWEMKGELKPADATAVGSFAQSVGISGDTIVVGTSGVEAFVFVEPPDGWSNLTEVAKLTGSDVVPSDLFSPVAIDGDTIVVGASRHDDGGLTDSGAAYVFQKPPGGWQNASETAKLTANPNLNNTRLGRAVSISGDTIVLGARGALDGRACVYVKPPGGWASMTQTALLTASDGGGGNQFGIHVAIHDGTVAVGSNTANVGGFSTGAAYVFVKPQAGWANMTQTAKLTPSDGGAGDSFGEFVAIIAEAVVIASPFHDGAVPGSNHGAAYMFVMPPEGWVSGTETTKLEAANAFANDRFGSAVSLNGETLLVGVHRADLDGWMTDAGKVCVFDRPPSGWSEATESEVITLDTSGDLSEGDEFGTSIAIDGETLVVGSPRDDRTALNQGSAFVFERVGEAWQFVARLTPSASVPNSNFGYSVGVYGNTVVAAAIIDPKAFVFERPTGGWKDMTQTATLTPVGSSDGFGTSIWIGPDVVAVGAPNALSSKGAVFVFERPKIGWSDMTQTARLTASDASENDQLGHSVSGHGDVIVAGASGADNGMLNSDRGAAYVFVRPPEGWANSTQNAKLTASDAQLSDQLGRSISMSGDVILSGAPQHLANGGQGRAYLFRRPLGGWIDTTEVGWLQLSDPTGVPSFGFAVAISDDRAVVGAQWQALSDPRAFVFIAPEGGWSTANEAAVITSTDAASNDRFARQVAISGSTSLISAHEHVGEAGADQGNVYGCHLSLEDCNQNGTIDLVDLVLGTSADQNANGVPDECEPSCAADVTGDNNVDVQDLLLVINNWGAGAGNVADVNGDGVVNVSDLLMVINGWGVCP